jgi:hypothetical protein
MRVTAVAAALLLAVPAWGAEVLVLASASTTIPRTYTDRAITQQIDNYGPNPIWCDIGVAAVVNKSHRIGSNENWVVDLPRGTLKVQCRAATADQATGLATGVTEAPR